MRANGHALDDLNAAEQNALGLSRAAILLDTARQTMDNPSALTQALNHNLELWVAIRTLAEKPESALPEGVRENLGKLGRFVADATFRCADGISDQTIDTLININLQISEGLLESAEKA